MDRAAGRILIVDDEPALLKMMSVYLGRLGYGVATADSTEQAWAEVQAAPSDFAVAVLDATMPGLSMQDLALRLLAASPSLRVYRRQRLSCGHDRHGIRGSGTRDVPAQAVRSGDAGGRGAEDDCPARRKL